MVLQLLRRRKVARIALHVIVEKKECRLAVGRRGPREQQGLISHDLAFSRHIRGQELERIDGGKVGIINTPNAVCMSAQQRGECSPFDADLRALLTQRANDVRSKAINMDVQLVLRAPASRVNGKREFVAGKVLP